MHYVGLDVHAKQSTICVLEAHGRRLWTRTIRGRWSKVLAEIEKIPRPFRVGFEASIGYGYLYDRLRDIADGVTVAHPGQLRLIFRSKHKNDRVDAEKLAKLLLLDAIPPVHVPSREVRAWRGLIEHRRRMVSDRTRLKNQLRSLLRGRGIEAPRGLWSRAGREWLRTAELGDEFGEVQRDLLLERLEQLNTMIRRLERVLDGTAAKHPGVVLLRTIPGVGVRTAEALMAYIDDPRRFGRLKAIGRYFGLVPRQDASAGVNRLGRITREGPGAVRQLLVEAVWQGVRRSAQIRAYYERIRRDDPRRRKIAVVATAHYLARVCLSMLQSGEVWRAEAA